MNILIKASTTADELRQPGIEAWKLAHQYAREKLQKVYDLLEDQKINNNYTIGGDTVQVD